MPKGSRLQSQPPRSVLRSAAKTGKRSRRPRKRLPGRTARTVLVIGAALLFAVCALFLATGLTGHRAAANELRAAESSYGKMETAVVEYLAWEAIAASGSGSEGVCEQDTRLQSNIENTAVTVLGSKPPLPRTSDDTIDGVRRRRLFL